MASTRIRGNRKPRLTIGAPGSEYAADLTSYSIENEAADSDTVTFEDAASGGGRQFFLRGAAVQSLDSASFWAYCWDNAGDTDVPYTLAPFGNASPTAEQPHFTGTLTLGPKPKISAEASTSQTSSSTFDYEFPIDGEPTLDRGAGTGGGSGD